eukprot:CAMPEP_0194378536 /NCGR_PEP_ID=MMETSP0174-20130528/35938_1 /TAXON_ID=216777 /ORGANISM="Proboscia alata, Strain PI-D3" /LENGTH=229 /DNA_ID=CAMNT_0039160641 /DNA_START=19 /DNA_END=708 /DNA_ORIENTATION=+
MSLFMDPNKEDDIVICDDGHRCENGSICVQNKIDEGNWYCDCDSAEDFDSVFAGLYCEHEATTYCTSEDGKKKSSVAFCTNGSSCNKITSNNEAHAGCDCLPGYTGDHCQYIEGTKPDDWGPSSAKLSSSTGNTTNHDKLGAGAITFMVLINLAVVGVIGFFAYTVITKRKPSTMEIASPDLHLEVDGAVLSGAVAEREENGDAGVELSRKGERLETVSMEPSASTEII